MKCLGIWSSVLRTKHRQNRPEAWREMCGSEVHVFVYGTLKKGQPNHYLLLDPANGKATYLGQAMTKQCLPLVVGSAVNDPYMLPVEGQGENIEGEVYEVDAEMLKTLDELEDSPRYYERLSCDVVITQSAKDITTKGEISCVAYFLTNFKDCLLELPMISSFDANNLPENCKDDENHTEFSLGNILAQVKQN